MGAGAEEGADGVDRQPLGEGLKPLGMELPPLGDGHPEDHRRRPAAEPAVVPLGVGIAERCVEPPLAGELPPGHGRGHRHGAPQVAVGGSARLHDEAALGNETVLVGDIGLEAVEDVGLVERQAIEAPLADFDARHDAPLGVDGVVDAQPPLEPVGAADAEEVFRNVVRRQAGAVVDEDIRSLGEERARRDRLR